MICYNPERLLSFSFEKEKKLMDQYLYNTFMNRNKLYDIY